MKHPVLRVKKGATVYDDDAPLSGRPEVREAWRVRRAVILEARSRKSRGRGRTLLIAVSALAVFFLLWSILPRSYPDRATLGGWQAILRATHSGDTLIVGVTFIAAEAGGEPTADIQIDVAGTDVSRTLSRALDKTPMTVREDIPFVAGMKEVRARVRIGEASADLRASLPAE
jgi:hypothetical protein